jgi:hypothetical protein
MTVNPSRKEPLFASALASGNRNWPSFNKPPLRTRRKGNNHDPTREEILFGLALTKPAVVPCIFLVVA